MGQLSVLLTGAGAPGTRGTLYALRHNPDGVRIRAIGTDVQPDPLARLWLDAFYPIPAPEEPEYLERLIAICRQEAIDLIVPQTTREIVLCARQKQALEAAGLRVMVSDPAAMEIANNKWHLLQLCERLQVPYPAYGLARSHAELVEAAAGLGYPRSPVVVKPPVSNGMRGFRVLRESAWDARRFLTEKPSGFEVTLGDLLAILSRGGDWPELLVTEYLPGAEYSVDAFSGSRAEVAIPRLRKAIRSGISFENELEDRPDLIQYTLTLGRSIGLQYAYGFQFKLDDQGLAKVLECNPRVQGTMVASLFGGVNVIWMGVLEALGYPPAAVPDRIRPAAFRRYWGGVGICGGQIDEI